MPAQSEFPRILYLPCFDYHSHRQRPQQLLYHLSLLGLDVMYCNVTQVPSQPFVQIGPHFVICQDIQKLDTERTYIMWLTHGPYAEQLHHFHLDFVISDIADASVEEFAAFARWQDQKVHAGNIVLCASQPIYDQTRDIHPRALLVRNGVDYPHFAMPSERDPLAVNTGVPSVLTHATAPVIGFWGAVASWIDFGLVERLAMLRPDYLFSFVGAISAPIPESLSRLSNVLFFGDTPYEALPQFASTFDAAIIPFQRRGVTDAANPIKLYEYLASGLPVVSTGLPEVAQYDCVRTADTAEEFARELDLALVYDRTPAEKALRRGLAQENSWERRARDVLAALHQGYSSR